MQKITLNDFKSLVLDSSRPVLLEFTGAFCPGCVQMAVVLNELEGEFSDRVAFLEVNADQETMLNTLLHVSTLPTTILFHHGKVLYSHRGFWPEEQLQKVLEDISAS